jgi:PKHD-type hydroxylase
MFVLPPQPSRQTATYAFLSPSQHEGAFTAEECRSILAMPGGFEPGRVQGEVVTKKFRDADVRGIPLSAETGWIFQRAALAAVRVNQQFWGFDLSGITTPSLQLVRYRKGQHHAWHRDGCDGPFSTRKLSITVQICSPKDYTGGELQFFEREEPTRIPPAQLEQGTIIVFPSYLLHRVTPVATGTRHALVVWIDGPPYK